ncbi:hypothetical protein PG987_003133 [Apiospora arundinis]
MDNIADVRMQAPSGWAAPVAPDSELRIYGDMKIEEDVTMAIEPMDTGEEATTEIDTDAVSARLDLTTPHRLHIGQDASPQRFNGAKKCHRLNHATKAGPTVVASPKQRARLANKTQPGRRRSERTMKKQKLPPLHHLSRLIRPNLEAYFAENFERALDGWTSLLVNTEVPRNIMSTDPRFLAAFKLLDGARTGEDSTHSRFAYIRLLCLFESLEKVVSRDRRNGWLLARHSGRRDAAVATDIYISAQDQHISRGEVKERKRVARYWRILGETFADLGYYLLESSRGYRVSKRLAETAELAARSIQHFDVRDTISQVKKDLLVGTNQDFGGRNQSFGGQSQDFGGQNQDFGGTKPDSAVAWSQSFSGQNQDFGGQSQSFGGQSQDFGGQNQDFGGQNQDFGGQNQDFGGTKPGFR